MTCMFRRGLTSPGDANGCILQQEFHFLGVELSQNMLPKLSYLHAASALQVLRFVWVSVSAYLYLYLYLYLYIYIYTYMYEADAFLVYLANALYLDWVLMFMLRVLIFCAMRLHVSIDLHVSILLSTGLFLMRVDTPLMPGLSPFMLPVSSFIPI